MQALDLNPEVHAMADELKKEQSCLMFGRGRNYATAVEAALKVMAWEEIQTVTFHCNRFGSLKIRWGSIYVCCR